MVKISLAPIAIGNSLKRRGKLGRKKRRQTDRRSRSALTNGHKSPALRRGCAPIGSRLRRDTLLSFL